MIEGMLLFLR